MTWLTDVLTDFDEQMFDDFESYCSEAVGAWETFSGNAGQMTIVYQYILPVVQEHIQMANYQWPYGAGPDDYMLAVNNCYDQIVIDRAFSDTINDSYSSMYEYWSEAMDLQQQHIDLRHAIHEEGPPHSTDPAWRAKSIF